MLYICIPSFDEAPTVGVLLWRIRKVFQELSREYEIVVYDDASTDATAETLAPYGDVLPLTVVRGEQRLGYAGALDALARTVTRRSRYARRDAAIFMQADFTDQPEHIPELVKRFEGGADLVVAERPASQAGPVAVQRLRRFAPWLLRPFVAVPGISDPFGSFRLVRVSVLRDVLKSNASESPAVTEGWAANVEFLLRAAEHARRVETVLLEPRYDLRPRETRVRPLADAVSLTRFGWRSRGRRPVVKPTASPAPSTTRTAT